MSYLDTSSVDYELIQEMMKEQEHHHDESPPLYCPVPACSLPGILARFLKDNAAHADEPILFHDGLAPGYHTIQDVGFFYSTSNHHRRTKTILEFFVEVTLLLERYPSFKHHPMLVNGQLFCDLGCRCDDEYRSFIIDDDDVTLR
jgi:hypothetical protein